MDSFIRNDKRIQGYYQTIYEDERQSGTACHDIEHAERVIALMDDLMQQLNVDETYRKDALIAGLLHDIGCVHGKPGHAQRGYEMALEYFESHAIRLTNHDAVLEAIRDHGSSYDSPSLMTRVLILCDKLDLVQSRLAPEGYETYGIRQIQHITAVSIVADETTLIVRFTTAPEFNLEEFTTFTFLDKVFTAITTFAASISREPIVMINDCTWNRKNIL
ncbi:HD domain-containing protein [Erysipelothrix sp. HDW6C]|uniref:HD domain-containing protein n=1 Tax=Erysipelothrix sp. HDW6C TaxID=2714930 RepID=UPI001408E517|nr:HD domain-containing protein [Erysipelothrix sp. HDW6C]QIK70797.1 HD domain-containing protein [Erysipelothrix sp. HDW6C]